MISANAKKAAFVLMSGALLLAAQVRANSVGTASDIQLLDAHDWQFLVGGFAEMDMFNDSTQGLTEVVGDNAIAPAGATALGGPGASTSDLISGADGRTMFSIRNSRFDFTAVAPEIMGWRDYGYMEFDLLGYDPQPPTKAGQDADYGALGSSTQNSESSFFENPTLRVRHMYAAATNGGWKILAGQYWDLFGFSPDYVLDTVSLSPVRGDLYERTPQLTVFYTAGDNTDAVKLDTAVSMERPVQDDSEVPGFDAALRLDVPGWTGAYASGSSSHLKAVPASFAVSGKVNTFDIPNETAAGVATSVSSTSYLTGEAVAFTTLIPIIPAGKDNFLSGLVFTGEYSAGSGYADEFSGWSGGEKAFAYNAASATEPASPNLDAGQGGFYNDNTFHLMNLESLNLALQYQLPSDWSTYFNGGYSQLYSDNMAAMSENELNFETAGGGIEPSAKAEAAYNLVTGWYGNVTHDFSSWFRTSLEFDHFTTTYVYDHVYAVDNRIQLSVWFLM